MMDPSNINNFEDQWRKAFQEASETPPPSVWEGIEARLDKEQQKVVPLWWKSPKMWYAAASLAALLLVGGGLWLSGESDEKVEVAVNQQPASSPAKVATPAEQPVVASNDDRSAGSGEQAESATRVTKEIRTVGVTGGAHVAIRKPEHGVAQNQQAKSADNSSQLTDIAQVRTENSVSGVHSISKNSFENLPSTGIASAKAESDINKVAASAVNADQSISAQLLASLPYSDLDVYVQKRHVFFRPEIQIEEPVKAKKQTEYYAGVGVMPASFNPDVQLKEAPTAFSAQSVSQRRAVSGSSEARASYAVQTQGGVRISKHWSVETGLSYLRGNSAYEGGGYVLNASNSAAANVLENALAGLPNSANSPALADKSSNFNSGALYIDVAKKVSNNYQYLQMPVQAGFTLNPDKKFSYSVLGGMMANFFLVNELESASGDIIKTTASDDIYRGMNWAATTGLRFNYKLSSNWAANLTGSYQKAVSSGFKSNQSLDSHPYLYGVSWSVRYSF